MSDLETLYFINGESFTPFNAKEIGFKLDWTGDAREAELNVDTIALVTDAKAIVIDWIENGQGVFEGIPLTIQAGTVTLEYYIDLTDNPTVSGEGDSIIEVTIKRRKAVDWFLQSANALSFEALNKTHPISTLKIPYLIIRDNQLEMLIMLGISAYTLTKALIEGVKELITAITDFIKITFVGTGVAVGQIIAAALLLIARLIYVAALIVALINITKQIIEIIFPPIRNLKGSTVLELLKKGCAKLGFEFKSTILDGEYKPLTILPVTLKKDTKSIFTHLFTLDNGTYNKGYPTARDTTPTLGSLINAIQDMFNAKIRIVGDTVFLERRDFWIDNSNITITNTLNLQDVRENQWRYNISEAWKRYYIHYRTDPSDSHTLDKIDKTDSEHSTEAVSVINPELLNIKGLEDVGLPWAFATPKEELTFVEKVALGYAKLADEVVQFFGGSSNLTSKVLGRIGVTQISQQYFTTTKIMYQVGGRQPITTYLNFLGALNLYNKFHAINQVKENFKRIYNAEIPFSTDMFENLVNNNYVKDELGNDLEIRTFEFINETKQAEIEYAILSDEGQNTKTILIDG